MKTVIRMTERHPVIRFAAHELARYLRRATGDGVPIVTASGAAPRAAVLRLGLFGAESDADHVRIEPEGRGYRLTGSNPRSVLFAAYRYLYELGFRWIRPGRRGEIVPRLKQAVRPGLCVDERPSYHYRTICIEGAASAEHVVALIDWLTKQGMNGYFVQFDLDHGIGFWERWYAHGDNPYMQKEALDAYRLGKIGAQVTRAITQRGLRFESMGHGWIAAALDVEHKRTVTSRKHVPPSRRAYLPEIGGKRDISPGGPGNTNLCYSNPAARQAMVAKIVAYARSHSEVTALHVWLADGSNNNCECKNCRKARPSDFYVDMLNELDTALSANGMATKIVFLIYVDLLWPPLKRCLRNPDRFILMFAPITRTYAQALAEASRDASMTPYVRNELQFPSDAAGNLAYLAAWQKIFHGDGFDFDYHLIWLPYGDLAQFTLARLLHRDIGGLEALGLNGYNSCQNQRQSFPHNLGMDVMARTLWNKRISFGSIVRETFADAYGAESKAVVRFFKRISALSEPFFEFVYTQEPGSQRTGAGLENLRRMRTLMDAFRDVVRRNRAATTGAIRWSWRYLWIYLDIMDLMIPAVEAYLRRDPECRQRYEAVFEYTRCHEAIVHPDLDVFELIKVLKGYINDMERSGPPSTTAQGAVYELT